MEWKAEVTIFRERTNTPHYDKELVTYSHVLTSRATITSYFSGLQLYDHKKSFPHTVEELQKQLTSLKSISLLLKVLHSKTL